MQSFRYVPRKWERPLSSTAWGWQWFPPWASCHWRKWRIGKLQPHPRPRFRPHAGHGIKAPSSPTAHHPSPQLPLLSQHKAIVNNRVSWPQCAYFIPSSPLALLLSSRNLGNITVTWAIAPHAEKRQRRQRGKPLPAVQIHKCSAVVKTDNSTYMPQLWWLKMLLYIYYKYLSYIIV